VNKVLPALVNLPTYANVPRSINTIDISRPLMGVQQIQGEKQSKEDVEIEKF
jgi:hypothetical protein